MDDAAVIAELQAGIGLLKQQRYKLQADNEKLQERIQKMSAGSLSPESRLSSYSVVVKELQKQIQELKDNINWALKELAHVEMNPTEERVYKALKGIDNG